MDIGTHGDPFSSTSKARHAVTATGIWSTRDTLPASLAAGTGGHGMTPALETSPRELNGAATERQGRRDLDRWRTSSRATVVFSSTIEPTGIDPRIESPDSFPARYGSTRPIALTASDQRVHDGRRRFVQFR
ncbi:hypothetical protein [Micromonospora eburnea]|uniref:hypothetical protein n=1 Tax=Micromonospora eburnea TaxID=227316 RepID=UPI001ABF25CA|nr:hypothetical protein [Micromonospora eburnea]